MPLVVPITLINHYVARFDVAYVRDQIYLQAASEGADAPQPRLIRRRAAAREGLWRPRSRRILDVRDHDATTAEVPSFLAAAARVPTRGRAPSAESGSREGIPWIHVGVFLAGAILVVLFTSHQIDTERETALTHWKTRLATIAADRARLVSSWLAARRADAEVLAAFPAVRAQLAGQGRDDEALARHLSRVAAAYGYVGIVISDAAGRAAARSASDTGLAAGLLEQAAEHAAQVAKSRKPRFDLGGEGAGRLLVVTVPVFSDGAPAGLDGDTRPLLGVVTLGAKPDAGLYPLLADDAEPTRTERDAPGGPRHRAAQLSLPAAPAHRARRRDAEALARRPGRARPGGRPGA